MLPHHEIGKDFLLAKRLISKIIFSPDFLSNEDGWIICSVTATLSRQHTSRQNPPCASHFPWLVKPWRYKEASLQCKTLACRSNCFWRENNCYFLLGRGKKSLVNLSFFPSLKTLKYWRGAVCIRLRLTTADRNLYDLPLANHACRSWAGYAQFMEATLTIRDSPYNSCMCLWQCIIGRPKAHRHFHLF